MNTRSIVNGVLYHYPRIALSMSDKDVVSRASMMFGTKLFQFENGRRIDGTPGKRMYRTTIGGQRAIHFMVVLLPFMGLRRSRKIQSLLRLEKKRPDPNTRRRSKCRRHAATRKRNAAGQFVVV